MLLFRPVPLLCVHALQRHHTTFQLLRQQVAHPFQLGSVLGTESCQFRPVALVGGRRRTYALCRAVALLLQVGTVAPSLPA